MNFFGKIGGLFGAVTQIQSRQHIAFGSSTHTGSAALGCFGFDLFPEYAFCAFNFGVFGIGINLFEYPVDFFHFQIDDIVHDALSQRHVFFEKLIIKTCFCCKRFIYIGIQVDGQQAATVVGAKRNFTAGIGGNRTESQIGITIGYRFVQYSIPKQYPGFGRSPGVVNNFFPQSFCVDFFGNIRVGCVNGVLLHKREVFCGGSHKFIRQFNRDIGSGHFAFGHFSVNEGF